MNYTARREKREPEVKQLCQLHGAAYNNVSGYIQTCRTVNLPPRQKRERWVHWQPTDQSLYTRRPCCTKLLLHMYACNASSRASEYVFQLPGGREEAGLQPRRQQLPIRRAPCLRFQTGRRESACIRHWLTHPLVVTCRLTGAAWSRRRQSMKDSLFSFRPAAPAAAPVACLALSQHQWLVPQPG